MNDQFGYVEEGGHDVRFVGFGYESLYMLANLNIIALFALFVLVFWLMLFIKDKFAAKCGKRCNLKERIWFDPFEARWHNFAMRFTYEVALELLICYMISLTVR